MGRNPCQKQTLVGIDIAHASRHRLVEKGCFDGAPGSLEALLKVGPIKGWGEGFRTQPLESCDHLARPNALGHPPHATKGACIHKAQLLPISQKPHPGVGAQGSLFQFQIQEEKPASHA